MWSRNEEFTYDKYAMGAKINIIVKDVDDLPISTKTKNLLIREQIKNSQKLADAFTKGKLYKYGFRVKTITEIESCLIKLKKTLLLKKKLAIAP